MEERRFPKVGETRSWRNFEHDGVVFDLSHLDAKIIEYENPKKGPPSYLFYVTFGCHCFTTSRPDDKSLGDYHAPKESRPFTRKIGIKPIFQLSIYSVRPLFSYSVVGSSSAEWNPPPAKRVPCTRISTSLTPGDGVMGILAPGCCGSVR